jgi:hypothetical protein
MSLTTHAEKITFIKDYFSAPGREYLLVYGSKSAGKFAIVKQGYAIVNDLSGIYATIIRQTGPVNFGDKTAPTKKCVILRESIDEFATNYIQAFGAEVINFLEDPVHTLYTIRNYDLEFRRWLRQIKYDSTDEGPLADLITMKEEFIKLDYDKYTSDTLVYNYGLRGLSTSIIFTDTTLEFSGFAKKYNRN